MLIKCLLNIGKVVLVPIVKVYMGKIDHRDFCEHQLIATVKQIYANII